MKRHLFVPGLDILACGIRMNRDGGSRHSTCRLEHVTCGKCQRSAAFTRQEVEETNAANEGMAGRCAMTPNLKIKPYKYEH